MSSKGILEDLGWSHDHDQDRRPKPVRHRFSELKNIECQVYTDSLGHLSRVIEKDTDVPPVARTHSEALRVITNVLCVKPGEIFLLLNSCVRKVLLGKLIDKKKALFETEAPRFFAEDSLLSS